MQITLATFNARWTHPAFALRCLKAHLKEFAAACRICEFDLTARPRDAAECLLAGNPDLIGFSVYLWNAELTAQTIQVIRAVRPAIRIVLGGPEVSHDRTGPEAVLLADHVVQGEGETAFLELCRTLARGGSAPKFINAEAQDPATLELPYPLYSEDDLQHRVLYVESSRGCPFECEYCVSSLEKGVRLFDLDRLLPAFKTLIDRGARRFKFTDRTFNLEPNRCARILQFFLDHRQPGMMLHFEMIPGPPHPAWQPLVENAPPGFFQFEVGIQTFNPETANLIRRSLDPEKIEAGFRWLKKQPAVHTHADLIAGLPGETLESFAGGFDRLLALGPDEIQVGILKKLRGTAIARHDREWAMHYNPAPPYELLQNRLLPFETLQRIQRFARWWQLIANNGRFPRTAPLIWQKRPSAFHAFLECADFLHAQTGSTVSPALPRLEALIERFLSENRNLSSSHLAEALHSDREERQKTTAKTRQERHRGSC
jgi:radical SAM superfamily enzyme YgiQ (UPF0313 family)